MKVKIKGSDIHGNYLYRGVTGTKHTSPILTNGAVCYFVTPDNDLPESLFLMSHLENLEEESEPVTYYKVKDLDDLSTLNTVQKTMIGKIYQAENQFNGTVKILGQIFHEDDVEKVAMSIKSIRKILEIPENKDLEIALIELHNELVSYRNGYSELVKEVLTNEDNTRNT